MPDRLGPYRLLERIGEGGMGVVYLASDAAHRAVAVKVLRPGVAAEPTALRRLAREVETMQRVRSPFVAEVIDADLAVDTPYIVTRYVDGHTLDQVIAAHGALRGAALAGLARGLADALAAVHAAGVVHRDLKPSNVMMLGGAPVVIDFGIAQGPDATRLTMTGMFMGTPGYLSPEVIEGQASSEASDVHAWGATVAFAATGRPPFGTGAYETIFYKIVNGQPDLDGAPAPLLPLLAAALARDPAHRPAAIQLSALAAVLDPVSLVPGPAPAGHRLAGAQPTRAEGGPGALAAAGAAGGLADGLAGGPLAAGALAGDALAGDALAGDALAGDVLAGDVLAGDALAGDALAGGGLAGDALAGGALAGDAFAGGAAAAGMAGGAGLAGAGPADLAGAGPAGVAGAGLAGGAVAGGAAAARLAAEALAAGQAGVNGHGAPGYGTPGYGTPGYGAPGYGAGGYAVPGAAAPAAGAPGFGAGAGAAVPAGYGPGTRPIVAADFADVLPPVVYRKPGAAGPGGGQPPAGAPAAGPAGRLAAGSPGTTASPRGHALLAVATMVILACVSVLLPVAGTAAALAAIVLLRAGETARRGAALRRSTRGSRPSDPLVAAVSFPWFLVRSVLGVLMLAPFAIATGALAAGLTMIAVHVDRLPHAIAYGTGALVAYYGLGPGSARPRSQLGHLYARVTRTRIAQAAALIAVVALAAGAATAAVSIPPLYSPVQPPPSFTRVGHMLVGGSGPLAGTGLRAGGRLPLSRPPGR
ncbi:MAG: serine/threonine-protein kinase [Gemmatimonadota bacterium]